MGAETMLAAVFAGEGSLQLVHRPRPVRREPDEVLLEVEGCGVCGTDLHILDTPPRHPATPGIVLGHEFIGRVVEAGPGVEFLKTGTRVAVAPNLNCGKCDYCRAGLLNHCRSFTTLGIFRDGGLAGFTVAPERACHPISDSLPFEEAVWTEVLSCVANSVDNLKPQPGETGLVVGAGPVGALHALLLRAAGARVIVSDIHAGRLSLLHSLGVGRTVHVSHESLEEAILQEAPLGADLSVDCVGNQIQQCVESTRVGGRISLFGMDSQARPEVRQNQITRKELTIHGSYVGVHAFPRAIEILESGVINPSGLISEVVALGDLPETLQKLRRGTVMKAVVRHRG